MKLVSLLMSAALTTPALAVNIRVIGNGGGEAEMRLLTEVSEVKARIQLCLQTGNPCELSANDLSSLSQLLKSIEGLKPAFTGDEAEYAFTHFSEAEATLLQLVKIAGLEFDGTAWPLLAHNLMSLVQVKEVSLAGSSQKLVFVKVGESLRLLIDNKSEVIEVTSSLIKAIRCEKPEDVRLSGLTKSLRPQAGGFATEVLWTCNGVQRASELQGRFDKTNGWRFQSFATRVVAAVEPICASFLVDHHN